MLWACSFLDFLFLWILIKKICDIPSVHPTWLISHSSTLEATSEMISLISDSVSLFSLKMSLAEYIRSENGRLIQMVRKNDKLKTKCSLQRKPIKSM